MWSVLISVDHVDSLIFVYHVYEFVRCSNVMKYWEVGFDYVVEFPFYMYLSRFNVL